MNQETKKLKTQQSTKLVARTNKSSYSRITFSYDSKLKRYQFSPEFLSNLNISTRIHKDDVTKALKEISSHPNFSITIWCFFIPFVLALIALLVWVPLYIILTDEDNFSLIILAAVFAGIFGFALLLYTIAHLLYRCYKNRRETIMSEFVRDQINRKYDSKKKGLLWIWGLNGVFIVLQLDSRAQKEVDDEERKKIEKMGNHMHPIFYAERLQPVDGDQAPPSPKESKL